MASNLEQLRLDIGDKEKVTVAEKFGKGVFGSGFFKKSSMSEGLITNGGKGRFIKPWGIGKSISMFAGFAVAGAVFQGAASMTGRALDTMLQDTKGQRQLSYDHRFFSGQAKYDRGSYDQFGQVEPGSGFKMQDAMNEYSGKMMSMARVYHSR